MTRTHRVTETPRATRWLVRLLALFLVPVLILTTEGVASAKPYGPTVDVTVDVDLGFTDHGGSECTLIGYWENVGAAPGVYMDAACSGGTTSVSIEDFGFVLSGSDATGQVCEVAWEWDTGEPGAFGGYEWEAEQVYLSIITDGDAQTCHLSDLCWDASTSGAGDDKHDGDCVAMDLGPIDAAPKQCAKFSLTPPTMTLSTTGTPTLTVTVPIVFGSGAEQRLEALPVYRYTGPSPSVHAGETHSGGIQSRWPGTSSTGWNSMFAGAAGTFTRARTWNAFQVVSGDGNTSHFELVGVQFRYASETAYNFGETFNDRLPQDLAAGDLGTTRLDQCWFYYGTKIAQKDGDTDNPSGPINETPSGSDTPPPPETTNPTPPPKSDDGCAGFSFTDPASWAGAGICVLVKLVGLLIDLMGDAVALLGSILAAIAGLVGAILDGLVGLFVPDAGFIDGKINDVKEAWADSAPFVFMEGVGDIGQAFIISNPGGNCAGPTLTVTSPVGGDTVNLSPMSSCRAEVATLAGIIKAALTVLVYVGGFLAAVRIVGGALGIRESPGVGGSAET